MILDCSERPVLPHAVGLYHLAWEVETLDELRTTRDRLHAVGALTGASDHASTKALYARDVDGIEFEVTWLIPDTELERVLVPGVAPTRPLDLDAEIRRYGKKTQGGSRSDVELMNRIMAQHAGKFE